MVSHRSGLPGDYDILGKAEWECCHNLGIIALFDGHGGCESFTCYRTHGA